MKRTKARKAHNCMSCSSMIDAGAFYFREQTLIKQLSRPLATICESCHLQGKFIQHDRDQTKSGPLDRFW